MTAIFRSLGSGIIQYLNQPPVKIAVKKIIGVAQCVFGLYEIYQILCGHDFSSKKVSVSSKWVQTAIKAIIVCAQISLLLSAVISWPGAFVISTLIGYVFSAPQLEKWFGPNTTFAINPWHPRHMISFVALILALPFLVQSVYKGIKKKRKVLHLMVIFNVITSRPLLHYSAHLLG